MPESMMVGMMIRYTLINADFADKCGLLFLSVDKMKSALIRKIRVISVLFGILDSLSVF